MTRPHTGERPLGVVYTPPALAEAMARLAVEPFVGGPAAAILALRICDPAIGEGAFLVALTALAVGAMDLIGFPAAALAMAGATAWLFGARPALALGIGLVLWFGGTQVLANKMTVGELVQFLLYLGLKALTRSWGLRSLSCRNRRGGLLFDGVTPMLYDFPIPSLILQILFFGLDGLSQTFPGP